MILQLKPLIGINDLTFGAFPADIIKQFGEPEEIEELNDELQLIETLKAVRLFSNTNGFSKVVIEMISKEPESLFKIYTCEGFKILLGRNAKNNDILTNNKNVSSSNVLGK